MVKQTGTCLLFSLFLTSAAVIGYTAASPPVKFPEPPPVQQQEVKVEVKTGPVELAADELYVLEQADANKPALLVASPEGIVTVTAETGPVRIRGKFANGDGKVHTKTFKASKVWIIEAQNTGTCQLLTWEIGTKEESGVYRYTIKSNLGPRPPPTPIPTPPGPTPPPVPIDTKGFRVLILNETSQPHTREQMNALNSTKIVDYLKRKTTPVNGLPGWKKWDPFPPSGELDVSREPETWQIIWSAVKPSVSLSKLPMLVVVQGQKAETFPITTEADVLSVLKRYGGE